jgi:competence protein ComEC
MKRLWVVSAFVAVGLVAFPALSQQRPAMTAHFIDVGQAHATLLEFPCGAMLIDAGSQDDEHEARLLEYLEAFFERRSDLDRTLDSIMITHNHLDHTRSLRRVVEAFSVERYIDNGFTTGSGRGGPNWLRREVSAGRRHVTIRDIPDAEVEAAAGRRGLTDRDIDPVACPVRDPAVRVLGGRFDENPGWPEGEFENQNNHSLVTRVDFGTASFLFMGDLEEAAIELLVEHYGDAEGGPLDTDVLQVGHHGSHNATTADLLDAVTPRVAVIPVGEWTFGRTGGNYTTFAFGHPRRDVIDLLSQYMTRRRTPAKTVKVAERARRFGDLRVSNAIYATGWDGTVRVVARAANDITVYREH